MASPGISGKKIPAYVHNLVTGTNITFKFYPEEVEDTHSSSFSQKEILGRSTPLLAYSGGGPREVSFSVILHDDFCDDGIINTVNKLKGLGITFKTVDIDVDNIVINPNQLELKFEKKFVKNYKSFKQF